MSEATRQLAAIMFTDIVGYTALMGQESTKALELIRISKEIQIKDRDIKIADINRAN